MLQVVTAVAFPLRAGPAGPGRAPACRGYAPTCGPGRGHHNDDNNDENDDLHGMLVCKQIMETDGLSFDTSSPATIQHQGYGMVQGCM